MAHKAIICQIDKVEEIAGANTIQIAWVLGEPVVVSKDWNVGFTGIFFPVDLQLSEEFVKVNNLSRKSEFNADPTVTGFFDTNRRVRAQPFMKVKSCGFFTKIDAVAYTGADSTQLTLSNSFDTLNGYPICQKYISEATRLAKGNADTKAAKLNDTPYFEKHVDTDNFKHYGHNIPEGALLNIQAKIHGTSARMGLTLVRQKLNWLQKFVNVFYPFFPEMKYDYVVGTRNVVLTNDKHVGFHGSEQFRYDVLEKVKPFLIEGMTIYGEIAGFANGKPIMATHSTKALKDKKFTKLFGDTVTYRYGCKDDEYRFHIYRITVTMSDGEVKEYSQESIDQFCANTGLFGPLAVHEPFVYDGNYEALSQLVEKLTERPEDDGKDIIDPSHPSEGVIVRVDYPGWSKPKFYKNKAYAFKVMEGLVEEADTEDAA